MHPPSKDQKYVQAVGLEWALGRIAGGGGKQEIDVSGELE